MDLEARHHATHEAFARLFGHVELPGGVMAMVTPESPERSVFNGVFYEDPAVVADTWEDLAARYADAGVRAWTVWVRDGDRGLAAALGERGHVLDATPAAMALSLDDADLDGPDLGEPVTWAEMAALNEVAYGVADGDFTAVPIVENDALTILGVPGRSVAGVLEVDGTAEIVFVATHPDARGQGLATNLMKQLLRGSRDRGCVVSTLEATKAGQPVYERMGYRSFGTLEMWEHRTS